MRLFRRLTPVAARADESRVTARLPSTFAEAAVAADAADFGVRAAAGVVLASSPDLEPVADVLLRLLLDHEETFVTSETADALVGRGDVAGMRLVVSALARVDDENTESWIWDVILYPETIKEHAVLTSSLGALTTEPDVAATAVAGLERLQR